MQIKTAQLKPLFFIILVIFLFLSFSRTINLTNSDIGRHIKNGEIFFQNFKPISTNYYSYTQPDFPTINHHWLSGIVFFTLWKTTSFMGLSILHTLALTAAVLVIYLVTSKKTNYAYALVATVFVVPFVATRLEIRPETFSYLLLAIYYLILSRFKLGKVSEKKIYLVLLLQLIWANSHIFFILGNFIIGIFWADSLVNKDQYTKSKSKTLLMLLLGSLAVNFVNPFGIKGALVPFTIFQEYGYLLAENQSILFMLKRNIKPVYIHYFISLVILAELALINIKKKPYKKLIVEEILLISFALLAFKTNRALPLYGLFFIPLAASFLYEQEKSKYKNAALTVSAGLLIIGLIFQGHYYSAINERTGYGIIEGTNHAENFIKDNNINAPIFNNYDVGGYLIYSLYPEYRVFTDNRPEAYSVEFFKEEYIPMQQDNDLWQKKQEEYGFNTIIFYRHDLTPWGQKFLIDRAINDPTWIPVYVDNYVIIMLKDNEINADLIDKFKLPDELFITRENK